jgi:peptide/nickel transport system substrate-binding protein
MTGPSPFSRRDFLQGGVLLGSAAFLAACGAASTPASSGSSTKPRRGGTLRAGLSTGASTDTLDADFPLNWVDYARGFQLYNSLTNFDSDLKLVNELADEITPNSTATKWTIRVKKGITFHNGKTLGADDVIFTITRIVEKNYPLAPLLKLIDLKTIRKIDAYTCELSTSRPYATLPEALGMWYAPIVPVGFDPKHPAGTGPFKFKSFTPNIQSVFVRNDNYFVPGVPYLDELVIVDYADDDARVNALESGAVDCIDFIPFNAVQSVIGTSGKRALVSKNTASWYPIAMRVDVPPFNDVRVRQAMRLIADRPALVKYAYNGYGAVANDTFGRYDPGYDHDLPQRVQDIDQAKSLLRAAGQSDLNVTLTTSDLASGIVESSTVFAQQASAAGVKIKLNEVPQSVYFGPQYGVRNFGVSAWGGNPYLPQVAFTTLATSPYNSTHFNNARYTSLYDQANATLDEGKRDDLIHEMQKIDYDEGSYIVFAWAGEVDGYRDGVNGLVPSPSGWPLNQYGFDRVWLSS